MFRGFFIFRDYRITGKGPGAAMEFALAVVELLQGKVF